jgi:hypothetical protein
MRILGVSRSVIIYKSSKNSTLTRHDGEIVPSLSELAYETSQAGCGPLDKDRFQS